MIERTAAPPPEAPTVGEQVDPFSTWLRSEGMAIGQFQRDAHGVHASMSGARQRNGARLEVAKSFAEQAARFEKLPVLDTVELTPSAADAGDPTSLPAKFITLTLRLARPPLDGTCIDPRVEVQVSDAVGAPPSSPPGVRITSVRVECAKEPVAGTKPPPDAGRALPRAASGTLPFVAICESISHAWGYRYSGRVVDKRGDVFTFSGGRPFSGTSAHELAVLVRHHKHYEGTLQPGDVDRLVSLAPQVEREPFQTKAVPVYDAPSGGCRLLRAGSSADALVGISFEEVGTTVGKRVGPGAEQAGRVLANALAL